MQNSVSNDVGSSCFFTACFFTARTIVTLLGRIWGGKNNNDERRNPTYLLTCLVILIVKELKISVEHGRVVKTLNIIKH